MWLADTANLVGERHLGTAESSLVVGEVPMQACRWHRTRRRGQHYCCAAARHAPAHRAEDHEAQEHSALRSHRPGPDIDSRSCTGWQIPLTLLAIWEPRRC
ncbi:hypothetical protein PsYK624_149370 [Phanerochaete sordida]|uniref:Uncharacterized protein n=1 Tax=Phanerochaete sordida TaxID=48140 RepID=A0A9P3GNF0_9APHY|nr:hypothetical protein PsYK624_149370 [Phanerochaete sordida]